MNLTITYELIDDGTLDTVIRAASIQGHVNVRFSAETAAPYREEFDGVLDLLSFLQDFRDEIDDELYAMIDARGYCTYSE